MGRLGTLTWGLLAIGAACGGGVSCSALSGLSGLDFGAGAGGRGGSGTGTGGGQSSGGADAGGAHAGGATAGGGGAGANGGSGGGTGGNAGGGGSGGGGGPTGGTIVPLYTDPPDASWDALAAAAMAHPTVQVVAIVNPNSGPGSQKLQSYTNGIANLIAAHVVVIGYVATGYTQKPADAANAEVDTWASFYPAITGIFFDEMSNTAGDEAYYVGLKDHAAMQGFAVTVGNPGTDTLPSYVGTVDTILIYESDGLPSVASLDGWHDGFAPSNFGVIPYAVGALDVAFVAAARQHVGYIYMTDDILPNPWDGVTSYLDPLLASLE